MKIEKSDAQKTAAETFGRRAGELQDVELAQRIKSLAEEGLIASPTQEEGWGIASSALQAVSAANPSLGIGAAMNILAADVIRRWSESDAPDVLEQIEQGHAIAAMVGPLKRSGAPKLGNHSLSGAVDRVLLAPVADFLVVTAQKDDNVTLLAISRDKSSACVGETVDTIGISEIGLAPVTFDGFKVADADIIGPDPLPAAEPDALLARWSLCIAAVLCGCSLAALEEVRVFSLEHKVNDKPVFKFQAQGFHLAEMFASLETARLMVDRAAYAVDTDDREAKVLCDSARVLADDVVEEVATKGSRVLGGSGTEAGRKFRSLMDDAETIRFVGEHPDALLSSVFNSISEQF